MPDDSEDSNDVSSNPGRRQVQESEQAADVLRSFAHDVSTPLANIKLGAEVLISSGGRLSEEQLADVGRNVSGEANRLRRMIDTLIEWSRFEIGGRPLRTQWHLAEDLIGSALRGMEAFLDDQEVVVTIVPDMAFVRGDDVLLEAVLKILIDNAASCTQNGEKVEVVVRADADGCSFEVIDAGPRFDQEEDILVETLFSAGRIAGTKSIAKEGSTRTGHAGAPGGGLGLILSRKIVEAHGGEIWARNRNDESGAVFAFVLGYGGESPPHALMDALPGDDGND